MDERDIIDDLVTANHILYNEGVVDGFGHVSVRHPARPDRFLLSRSIAPGNVKAEDIMEFDLDGNPVDAIGTSGRKPYLERFIHSEVYRVRADVQAVVHNHSPAVIPFGVTNTKLRPISHMSGFLTGNVPNFEIRDAGGPATDMLIRTPQLGVAFARTLGKAAFALMRGHGAVAVGDSIRQVVYRAVYAEQNARLQSEALRLAGQGEINFLNDAEAAGADAANYANMDRPWELWKMRVRKNAA
jgi:HCOMODA/2-hydroxy-3-carboxy-muconic semialdehyde decarboxylase